MTKKVLTICIPAYNVGKYIKKNIDSIIASNCMEKLEILVINDGSSDDTLNIVLDYQRDYKNSIKIINKTNGGHGSCINIAKENATGKYFKNIDGDDWVDSNELKKIVNELEFIEVDLILTPNNWVYVNSNEYKLNKNDNLINATNNFDDNIEEIKKIYTMHSIIYNTKIIKKMKDITEHCFYVDQEYIFYPLYLINSFKYLDNCLYQYRIGRIEQSVSFTNYIKNREMHKRVIDNIYLSTLNNELTYPKYNMLCEFLYSLIYVQFKIYFNMPLSFKTYKEVNNFVRIIKKYNIKNCKSGLINILKKAPYLYFLLYFKYHNIKYV